MVFEQDVPASIWPDVFRVQQTMKHALDNKDSQNEDPLHLLSNSEVSELITLIKSAHSRLEDMLDSGIFDDIE